jgi:cytoskeletal protein RodZ
MIMQYTTQKQRKKGRGKWWLIFIFVVLIIISGLFWWHRVNPSVTTVHTNTGTATANPNVPGATSNTNSPTTGASASKDQGSSAPGTTPSSSVQPATPTGEFVSDHRPNLSGKPAPNTETSTCTTTPGILCQIKFSYGNTTRSLPSQKTDANGNAVWNNWTLQDVGLTTGTWQVTALATNGSKAASAQDTMKLVVSQ